MDQLRNSEIGVIIPTFNRPIETVHAITSALNQTYPVSKIVVIDDGSSLENYTLLCKMIHDPKVEIIRTEHTGHPGKARQSALSRLQTNWIAFLDSDDIWTNNKLELQMSECKRLGLKAICSNAIRLNSDSNRTPFFEMRSGFKSEANLLKYNFIINSSVLLERDILMKIGGLATSYSTRGAEDYATWLRVSAFTNWYYLNEPLVTYKDDGIDSLRGTDEFPQIFSDHQARFDFANWRIIKRHENLVFFRLVLKILPYFLMRMPRKRIKYKGINE